MKTLLLLLALVIALAAAIVFWPGEAAQLGPEPIVYGQATCARCRMHLARPGFAGQMREPSGQLHSYDDIGCLLLAMWQSHREATDIWVETHEVEGQPRMVQLTAASFVVDSRTPTPMGYGVLAFADPAQAARFTEAQGGRAASLEQILADTQRFRRTHAGQE